MSEITPLNARSLSYKNAGHSCTVEFDGEYLTCSTHNAPGLHVTKTPLRRILPELLVDRSVPDLYRRYGRNGRYYLIAGIIIYFSDIRAHVPLLAPALLISAAYSMYRVARVVWPFDKTKIVTEWGDEIAVIPHHEKLTAHRKRFEEALLDAVREAKHRYEEG